MREPYPIQLVAQRILQQSLKKENLKLCFRENKLRKRDETDELEDDMEETKDEIIETKPDKIELTALVNGKNVIKDENTDEKQILNETKVCKTNLEETTGSDEKLNIPS